MISFKTVPDLSRRAEASGPRGQQRQNFPNDNIKRLIAYFFNEHVLIHRSFNNLILSQAACEERVGGNG